MARTFHFGGGGVPKEQMDIVYIREVWLAMKCNERIMNETEGLRKHSRRNSPTVYI